MEDQKPKSATATLSRDEDAVYDAIYQNERGSALFGTPRFSSKGLLPAGDYPPWSNESGKFELSRETYKCPPTWTWISDWMVDMTQGCDADGWQYASKFSSDHWQGSWSKTSLVRRRRWIRLRRRLPSDANPLASSAAALPPVTGMADGGVKETPDQHLGKRSRGRTVSTAPEPLGDSAALKTAVDELAGDANDRRRLERLAGLLGGPLLREPAQFGGTAAALLQTFDYETSRLAACAALAPLAASIPPDARPALARRLVPLYQFFSDQRRVCDLFGVAPAEVLSG